MWRLAIRSTTIVMQRHPSLDFSTPRDENAQVCICGISMDRCPERNCETTRPGRCETMAKDYQIAKTPGACTRCDKAFAPEQVVMATVREGGQDGFIREDYCLDCWPSGDEPTTAGDATTAAPADAPATAGVEANAPETQASQGQSGAVDTPAEPAPPAASEILASWQTVIPKPAEKKKLLVDDEVLMNFFRRLADTDDPAKVTFRYVLGLILMRKRKLIYDGPGRNADGVDIWKMHFRGTDEKHEVIDPGMDEDQILDVSQNLSQIMELDE